MQVQIGISDKDRETIATGLSRLLADSYTLYLKTHNYHWNVTGPQFNTLHTMFEDQYTELATAVEQNLALPIILWNNVGLKQIQDDMKDRDIELVGVTGINPDFISLAKSCHCHALKIDSAESLTNAVQDALQTDRPTLIEVNEWDPWLN